MGIDEAIAEMEKEFIYFLEQTDMKYPESIKYERENNPDFDRIYTANTMALDIMRKYQKIEQIVKSKTTRVSYDIGFRQIKKVVENGNDTTNTGSN